MVSIASGCGREWNGAIWQTMAAKLLGMYCNHFRSVTQNYWPLRIVASSAEHTIRQLKKVKIDEAVTIFKLIRNSLKGIAFLPIASSNDDEQLWTSFAEGGFVYILGTRQNWIKKLPHWTAILPRILQDGALDSESQEFLRKLKLLEQCPLEELWVAGLDAWVRVCSEEELRSGVQRMLDNSWYHDLPFVPVERKGKLEWIKQSDPCFVRTSAESKLSLFLNNAIPSVARFATGIDFKNAIDEKTLTTTMVETYHLDKLVHKRAKQLLETSPYEIALFAADVLEIVSAPVAHALLQNSWVAVSHSNWLHSLQPLDSVLVTDWPELEHSVRVLTAPEDIFRLSPDYDACMDGDKLEKLLPYSVLSQIFKTKKRTQRRCSHQDIEKFLGTAVDWPNSTFMTRQGFDMYDWSFCYPLSAIRKYLADFLEKMRHRLEQDWPRSRSYSGDCTYNKSAAAKAAWWNDLLRIEWIPQEDDGFASKELVNAENMDRAKVPRKFADLVTFFCGEAKDQQEEDVLQTDAMTTNLGKIMEECNPQLRRDVATAIAEGTVSFDLSSL